MSLIREFKDRIKSLERDLALANKLPAPVVAEKQVDSSPEYDVTFYGYTRRGANSAGKEIAKISTPMTSQEFADYGSVPKDFIKEMHTGNVEQLDKGFALIHTTKLEQQKEKTDATV
jgi:hypothetical protein